MNGFFKKCDGAISIFLAIIMLANFVLSGVLVEGARLRQAEAIIQSAADSAAQSVLAKYDKELYDRYGLFVMDEETQANIQSDYIDFFMSNLSAALPSEDSLNTLFTQLEAQLGLKGTYKDIFDMYDFQADDVTVQPTYSIGAPQILQLQTTEVSKYRSAFLLLQDVTGMGDKIANAADEQQKDVELMQDSLDYRESTEGISNKLVDYSIRLYKFYDRGDGTYNNDDESGTQLKNDYSEKIAAIDTAYSEFSSAYGEVGNAYAALNNAIGDYNNLASQIADAEEELQRKKSTIQFDSTAEDYDSTAVDDWNRDKSEIDSDVTTLKSKLSVVEREQLAYNEAISDFESKKTELLNKIDEMKTMLNGKVGEIDGFITEWGTLEGEIDSAISQTENFEGQISSSGASSDVQDSSKKDADTTLESLNKAKNAGTVDKLNKTKSYINDVITSLDSLRDYVNGATLAADSYDSIDYEDSDGTIAELQAEADRKNASKAPDEDDVRPDWQSLSQIKTFSTDVKITPSDFFSKGYANKVQSVKKPNGKDPFPADVCKHYKYESGVTYDSSITGGSTDLSSSSTVSSLRSLYDNNKGTTFGSDDDSSEPSAEIDDSTYRSLPSQNRDSFKLNTFDDSAYESFFTDRYGATMPSSGGSGGLSSGSDNVLDSFSTFSVGEDKSSQDNALGLLDGFMAKVESFFTGAQYDVATYVYTMSMFKNRLSRSPGDYWKTKYENIDKTALGKSYVERDSEDADLNLMLDHMFAYTSSSGVTQPELKTKLNCEIEYIIRGQKSDKSNRNQIWAIIYGLRMGNNLVAVYTNKELKAAASATAQVIAAAAAAVTFGIGGILAPLIEFAIIAVLAALETYYDMVYLVNMGYKVPFIKTKDNLNISLENLSTGNVTMPNIKNTSLLVKYEDYLLIFLLFVNQENVLYRMADLIQMNMELETGESYDLSKRFTYVRCANNVSIKPLMISYAFMPDDLRRDDRRVFKSLIYQGY